jgi:hypothetical protein
MVSGIYILGNQGLGDQIVLNGLYRYFADRYDLCVIPIGDRYKKTIREMTKDVQNILVTDYRMEIWEPHMLAHRNFLKKRGFHCLNLGTFGPNYLVNQEFSLDQTIYQQAEIRHQTRWSDFRYLRNISREKQLFERLGCKKGEYIFVHDDPKRALDIESKLLPENYSVIKPIVGMKRFSFFDYIYIIENAAEVHCIESSFAVLIEQLDIKVPKYIHRYARPEVLNDPKLHYSLKSHWRIISEI